MKTHLNTVLINAFGSFWIMDFDCVKAINASISDLKLELVNPFSCDLPFRFPLTFFLSALSNESQLI